MDPTMLSPAYTTGLLHEVVAGHDPDRVALRFRGPTTGELTYGEVERRSNQLAHALNRVGVGPGHVVGLLLNRGLHLPTAQLGVMKAGAAWTPLDPRYPLARLAFQLNDAAASLVLTATALAGPAELVCGRTPYWSLDDPHQDARLDICPDATPDVNVRPDDAAYLIYTSGSTGTPKGVLVSHRSAHAFCRHAVDVLAVTPVDRVAQTANPSFDASIFDCFATLLAGGTIVSAPHETIADPAAFTTLLRDERVTLTFIPPAILGLLDPDTLTDSALRLVYTGGDVLGTDQANRWTRPGLELRNVYGPTETTVFCTQYRLPRTPMVTPPPIGTALPHQRTYVLDARLRPLPVGVPGQLFVAGVGVAHGYHNRAALTAQRFLPDPYDDRPGQRMYATGDRVRWRSDGVLDYLGRLDRQVKIRGLRIELGEIEHALTQHPDVRQCAVVLRDNSYLAAYLVGDANLAEVRMHLAQRLPGNMLPSTYVTLPELPLTPSGKLDTARLPDPSPRTVEYRHPRTDTERWLADTWLDLLGVERVGAGDTLFDLGANSLHTTQLTARVRDRFNVELDPRELFADPTLEQLAARIDEAATTTTTTDELDDDLVEIAALERMLAEKRAEKARRALSQRPM
jgi:amino acid adenylation domain-containing protein